MKRIKQIALSVVGMAVVTVGFVACSSDDATASESNSTEKEDATMGVKAVGGNVAYQNFYLGQIGGSGEYLLDCGDDDPCADEDADCLPELVIVVDRKKKLFSQLVNTPLNYQQIFVENKDVLMEDIHPVLVNGVIDGFFSLETVYVKKSKATKFRFRRMNDNKMVGTYQFVL